MSYAVLILGKCSLEVPALSFQALQMSLCQNLGTGILLGQGAWPTHSVSPRQAAMSWMYEELSTHMGTGWGDCD